MTEAVRKEHPEGSNRRSKRAQLERVRSLTEREKLVLVAKLSATAREMRRLARGSDER